MNRLFKSIVEGDVDEVERVIHSKNMKMNLNGFSQVYNGETLTPLMCAIKCERDDIVHMLLSAGVKPHSARREDGMTALRIARLERRNAAAEMIIRKTQLSGFCRDLLRALEARSGLGLEPRELLRGSGGAGADAGSGEGAGSDECGVDKLPSATRELAHRARLAARVLEVVAANGAVDEALAPVCERGSATEVHLFGSSASLFGSLESDVDLLLHRPWRRRDPIGFEERDAARRTVVSLAAQRLRDAGFTDVETVLAARVPIVRFREPALPTSGGGGDADPGGRECDLCFNNSLAMANTALLRTYARISPVVRPLAFAVKQWARRRGLNRPVDGTLSSYAFVIMVIHFLQRRSPAVLPDLQHPSLLRAQAAAAGVPQVPVFTEGCDVSFCDDVPLARAAVAAAAATTAATAAALPADTTTASRPNGDCVCAAAQREMRRRLVGRPADEAFPDPEFGVCGLEVDVAAAGCGDSHGFLCVGALMLEFFVYFGERFPARDAVVEIHDRSPAAPQPPGSGGGPESIASAAQSPPLRKKAHVWGPSDLWRISIRDPFNAFHDLGKVMTLAGQRLLTAEFERALAILRRRSRRARGSAATGDGKSETTESGEYPGFAGDEDAQLWDELCEQNEEAAQLLSSVDTLPRGTMPVPKLVQDIIHRLSHSKQNEEAALLLSSVDTLPTGAMQELKLVQEDAE